MSFEKRRASATAKDHQLRRALEPPPEAVDRIIGHALAEPHEERPSRTLWVLASSTGCAAALIFLVAVWRGAPPHPTNPSVVATLTNVGTTVGIYSPSGDEPLELRRYPAVPRPSLLLTNVAGNVEIRPARTEPPLPSSPSPNESETPDPQGRNRI